MFEETWLRLVVKQATGTGKTVLAKHLLWKLASGGQVKKALFLVDRDELRTQALNHLQEIANLKIMRLIKRGYKIDLINKIINYQSKLELKEILIDFTIENNSSLEEFSKKIYSFLDNEKL